MERVFQTTVPVVAPGRASQSGLVVQISYRTKRGAAHCARMDVPEDLIPIPKTQTRKQSVKTKDKSEAKRRLWPVVVR